MSHRAFVHARRQRRELGVELAVWPVIADVVHAGDSGRREVCDDQPRLDQDRVDPEPAHLKAQRVRDRLDRVLGRVVVAAAGKRQPPAHRADVDDLAPALLAHLSQHELGQRDEPEHVRLELPAHRVQPDLLDRAALAVAGVVDQHAHGPVRALYLRHRRAHRLLVGHVQRQRSAARLGQVGNRLRPASARVHRPTLPR